MYGHYIDELYTFIPKNNEPCDLKGLQFFINRIPCMTATEKELTNMLYQVCEAYQEEYRRVQREYEKFWQSGFEEENT